MNDICPKDMLPSTNEQITVLWTTRLKNFILLWFHSCYYMCYLSKYLIYFVFKIEVFLLKLIQ